MNRILVAILFIAGATSAMAQSPTDLSLAGQWQFRLDPTDAGINEQWFAHDLPDRINLPGSLQAQGFGEEPSAQTKWTTRIGAELLSQAKYAPYQKPGDYKTPFWLTPRRHYVGPAWYQRQIEIGAGWEGKRIVLFLERPHWETTVWVDGKSLGSRNSLGTPHVYDLTSIATPGPHTLTIRVDNRVKINVGLDAHSVSDQTQGNWNGIIGQIKLLATDKIWIDDVQVFPDPAARKVKVSVAIGNLTGAAGAGKLTVSAKTTNTAKEQQIAAKQVPMKWNTDGSRVEFDYDLGADGQLWDEFSPVLYQLDMRLDSDPPGAHTDSRSVIFGLRNLAIDGTQFTINGRKIFLRGTLECCIFPLTGYPPTDVAPWKRILSIARAHGLNHIRFHSWCPPEAAFIAADEMGFYYSVEASCWTHFGAGEPIDKWVAEEGQRMLRAYGNHPSFLLMVPSNEPNRTDTNHFLANLVQSWTNEDPRRRYTAGSGWPTLKENNYDVISAPRLAATKQLDRPPQTAFDYRDIIAKHSVPVVSHEIGQWCAYPNFDEIPKYTGFFKPGNLEIFRDFLRKAGMEQQAHDFLMASGKFQVALYKAEIEAALRTDGMGGFQLLDVHDFPGQGTAPVGVLDAFWDDKGYVTADEYRRFCGPTVPLARLDQRTFTADESFTARIEIAHYGPTDLSNMKTTWRIRDAQGKVLRDGQLAPKLVPTGGSTQLGDINVPVSDLPAPAKLNLEVTCAADAEHITIANDWDFWTYPQTLDDSPPANVRIAETLDDASLSYLNDGGRLVLLPGTHVAGDTVGSFQPIFWNRVTFPKQRIHTLGILCDPTHNALLNFPTDSYTNWQWWDLQRRSKPMVLDALPRELKPIVQVIDDWNVCRRLGLILEARVGKGRLLLCSIDLDSDLAARPVARQLRSSLLRYAGSDGFKPAVKLTVEQVKAIIGVLRGS